MGKKETVLQTINRAQFGMDDIFFAMDSKSPSIEGCISNEMMILLEDALENITRFKDVIENAE